MQSKILENFLTTRYYDIVTMASKICKGSPEHEDVAHYVILEFVEHPRAEEFITSKKAMNFLSGMIHLSFHSSTSPYHTLYRQKGRVHPQADPIEVEDILYNHDIDMATEAVLGILEEMKISGDQNIWYMAVLFDMWMLDPNYSNLSRQTRIPRTSISQAVQQCAEYVKQELKNRNLNYEL
jgi:hypothetical protein